MTAPFIQAIRGIIAAAPAVATAGAPPELAVLATFSAPEAGRRLLSWLRDHEHWDEAQGTGGAVG